MGEGEAMADRRWREKNQKSTTYPPYAETSSQASSGVYACIGAHVLPFGSGPKSKLHSNGANAIVSGLVKLGNRLAPSSLTVDVFNDASSSSGVQSL